MYLWESRVKRVRTEARGDVPLGTPCDREWDRGYYVSLREGTSAYPLLCADTLVLNFTVVVEVVVKVNGTVSSKSNDLNLICYGSVFEPALSAHMVDLCGLCVV